MSWQRKPKAKTKKTKVGVKATRKELVKKKNIVVESF